MYSRLIFAIILLTFNLLPAGEPLLITPNALPYRWDTAGPVQYRFDGGMLGRLSNAEAISLIDDAFRRWADIPTAAITFENSGQITDEEGAEVDIDLSNFFSILNKNNLTGQNQIVFDENGDIFNLLFGESSGVVGFAGPDIVTGSEPYQIIEGSAFLNGAYVDGRLENGEFSLDAFKAVAVHEFGHFINIAHSQVNGSAILEGRDVLGFGVPPLTSLETMFPVFFDNSAAGITPHADDIAIVSTMYPATPTSDPFVIHNTGTITGKVFASDGEVALNGVNVVARNTSGGAISVFLDAISQITGAQAYHENAGGSSDPFWQGRYIVSGLTPGADYAIAIDELGEGFYSSPVLSPLPAPPEFYNGANESGNPAIDRHGEIEFVQPVANIRSSDINIILNKELSLRRYDDSIESVRSPTQTPGSEAYFAVRFAVPASIDSPFTVSRVRFYNNDELTIWPQLLVCHSLENGQPALTAPDTVLVDVAGGSSSFIERDLHLNLAGHDDFFVVIKFPPGQSLIARGRGGGPGIGADDDLRLGFVRGNLLSSAQEFVEILDYNLAVEVTLHGQDRLEPFEPNDNAAEATPVTLGTSMSGYLGKDDDVDIFQFFGNKGDFLRFDLSAVNIGSLLDAVLILTDAGGNEIARNDDRIPGVNPDPLIEIELPDDGIFQLKVDRFVQSQHATQTGGQAYFYNLALEKPDKRLWITHATGTVSFTLWANGIYGDEGTGRAGGFSFGGRDGGTLFSGGFVAVSGAQIAANIPSLSLPNGSKLLDLESENAFDEPVNSSDFQQIATTIFSDGPANFLGEPLDISVRQTSHSNAGDAFVLLSCSIKNEGQTVIENLYLGQFADWDVGVETLSIEKNRGGYDAARSLVYQYENEAASDSSFYGVKALQAASGARVTSELDPNLFLNYLSDFNGPGPEPVLTDDDLASFIGVGPFTLPPGDSTLVGFAWLAGNTLMALQENADDAQRIWQDFVVSVDEPGTLPDRFELLQNYPNPFNPETQITYTLQSRGQVSLIIYNALGQRVRTLVDETQFPGIHQVEWDGRTNMGEMSASGIYFYQLHSGRQSAQRKMILLR